MEPNSINPKQIEELKNDLLQINKISNVSTHVRKDKNGVDQHIKYIINIVNIKYKNKIIEECIPHLMAKKNHTKDEYYWFVETNQNKIIFCTFATEPENHKYKHRLDKSILRN